MIGLPGSGKTTQAELLAGFLNVPIISSGGILRDVSAEEDEEAEKIKSIMLSGELVSDEIIADLVKKRLQEKDGQNGFVMEGYPRTKKQIELLDPGFDKAFYLDLSEDQLIDRMLTRGRLDDSLEAVKKRIEVQKAEMQDIINYYKEKGILVELDGSLDIESLQKQIKNHLHG